MDNNTKSKGYVNGVTNTRLGTELGALGCFSMALHSIADDGYEGLPTEDDESATASPFKQVWVEAIA